MSPPRDDVGATALQVKHKCITTGLMVDGTGLHFVASMIAGVAVAATTRCVHRVVLQKSIPLQIRQLILYCY